MNPAGAYTPLECLLLFQSLVAFGTREEDFVQISDLLTNSALVKDGETYDGRRLTVHALKDLYTRLLRDEVNADAQDVDDSNPKKRKLQSPTLSLQDVQEYGEKLPVVVDRLYARYRQYMIHAIREEERRYAVVTREIAEIEGGHWDERILAASKSTNGAPHLVTTTAKINGTPTSTVPQVPAARAGHPQVSIPQHEHSLQNVASNLDRTSSPKPIERSRAGPQPNAPLHARTPSAGPHGPSPLQSGYQSVHNGQPPPPQNFAWVPAYQPGQQNVHPQYNAHYQNQYHQQQPPPRGPTQSPLLPPTYGPVPSSPMNVNHPQYAQHSINTPQTSHRGSPASPALPYQHAQDNNGHMQQQQGQTPHPQSPHPPPFRSNSGSPMVPPGGLGYPPHFVAPRPSSATGGQYQQWQQGTLPPQPPHFPPNYQQYPVPHPQQQFQATPQRFIPSQSNPQLPGNAYNSPYEHGGTPQGLLRAQNQPPSTPKPRPAANATGFGTKWTPTPTGRTPGEYQQVRRPVMEAISPILASAQLATESKPSDQPDPKPAKTPSGSKKGTQTARASDIASSAIVEPQRSQSAMSNLDEKSSDEAITRPVKEEVNTPRGGIDEVAENTVDESTSQPHPSITNLHRTSLKRKRAISKVETHPNQVEWTRNFPVISRSALDQITAHKNGGMFALPVKERDAPGYKDLIKRPQDFKTIRASVIAGNRAATAVAAEMDVNPTAPSVWLPASEELVCPKGIVNSAQFERELMRVFANAVMFNPDPDRGLCKRWRAMEQDEQGVIGYAIDEDSVVKDTKDIFTDAELILENLRAAERRSEEKDDAALARDEDDGATADDGAIDGDHAGGVLGSVAKRRRKA